MVYYQRMQFFGTEGKVEVEVPFNAPSDQPCRILIDNGKELYASGSQVVETVPVCNQFTIQFDKFSEAIRRDTDLPTTLEDSIHNMALIDAIFRSGVSGSWELPERL